MQQKSTKNMNGIAALLGSQAGVDALEKFKKQTTAKKQRQEQGRPIYHPSFMRIQPQLSTLEDDGVDHINVSTYALNDIGRALSIDDATGYYDHFLGVQVHSLRTFDAYLRTGMIRPAMLKSRPPRMTAESNVPCEHMFALMAQALYFKITQHPTLATILKELQVPLDWYIYTPRGDGTQRVRHETGVAYVEALRDIRHALINGYEFQLHRFLSNNEGERIRRLPEDKRMRATQDLLRESCARGLHLIEHMKKQTKAAEARERQARAKQEADKKEQDRVNEEIRKIDSGEVDVLVFGNKDTKGIVPAIHIPEQALAGQEELIDKVAQVAEIAGNDLAPVEPDATTAQEEPPAQGQ